MRRVHVFVAASVVALLFVACAGEDSTDIGRQTSAVGAEQSYLIAWPGHSVPADAAAIIEAAGGVLVESIDDIGASLAVSASETFLEDLEGGGAVHSAGLMNAQGLPDGEEMVEAVATEDVSLGMFWGYQWDIRRVNAPAAWETTEGSHDTVVAVIDTGVAWGHPDLAPNVVFATCYNVGQPCSAYPYESYHGTHVAGTIAGAGAWGVTGVGPGLGLASYNVFQYIPEYGGVAAYDWSVFMAILDAADNGFQVINMSLGGYVVRPRSQEDVAYWTLYNRITNLAQDMGTVIVASAGNDAFDLNGPVNHLPSDLPSVISVSASGIRDAAAYPAEGSFDVPAFYTNTGASVMITAPGGDLGPDAYVDSEGYWTNVDWSYGILSAYWFYDEDGNRYNSLAWALGTSMASPHVAGVAGLLRDAEPGLSPNQVTSRLRRTAESLGDRLTFGHGMVDAEAALR